ncbi:isopentenyl-diphosphate Delta-isomerase [Ruminiclostridium herbifermentans]|uniref:Isopentenyl-diphosphate delta-isomerase n=1 Tax=Ruminiclostridium herbifermentans TaxID=2488810 RepID=A0A4V6EP12_9FIRM|nr:isopentenyl-diphosphate Delta-isomerase [Ruminiclostridium herbifermentans]QNU66199.1 isopentenyl-diphosphate Delta-isomerase [Ruminiclostridium herbifermentans]
MDTIDNVILVNNNDEEIGALEKMDAHRKGKLHRAFSILIFNSRGQLLLQKRAKSKYHSGGLWTNTCCSHPRPGESTKTAANRRLTEEMGFTCNIYEAFSFIYKVQFNNELMEYEYDHVFIGKFDGTFSPNIYEVEDWSWKSLDEIEIMIQENPDDFTFWFKVCFEIFLEKYSHTLQEISCMEFENSL